MMLLQRTVAELLKTEKLRRQTLNVLCYNKSRYNTISFEISYKYNHSLLHSETVSRNVYCESHKKSNNKEAATVFR